MNHKVKIIGLLGFIFLGLYYYIFKANNIDVASPYYLTLEKNTPSNEVLDLLKKEQVFKNEWAFDFVLGLKSFKNVPKGRYKIVAPLGNYELISKLKNGYQDPLNFTLSTATFVEEIGGKVGSKLQMDSTEFMSFLYADSTLNKYNLNRDNALCFFIPNTLEMYWTISKEQFMARFEKENEKFWTASNLEKAKKLNLTPNQVYILASLVQKEYYKKEERSKIATVLLNRMKINMPLQVDATCKYATKDFAAKRVTQFHTTYDSPHNTYKIIGLPPSPICMPEKSTIEAVLNPDSHDYLYYCADPSLNGFHIFSTTLAQHEKVASTYHSKMNELKIK